MSVRGRLIASLAAVRHTKSKHHGRLRSPLNAAVKILNKIPIDQNVAPNIWKASRAKYTGIQIHVLLFTVLSVPGIQLKALHRQDSSAKSSPHDHL